MRNVTLIVVGLVALATAAFWIFSSRDYVFRFSEDELRDRLDARLPYEGRHLFVFNVALDNPRIDLVEGSDRVAGGIDVSLAIKLGGRDLVFDGAADMAGGVRYDAEQGAFFLKDPVVERLRLNGIPDNYANKANDAISLALREFYKTRPLYVLDADTTSKSAARLLLKDVSVHDEHLVVTLGLKRKTE